MPTSLVVCNDDEAGGGDDDDAVELLRDTSSVSGLEASLGILPGDCSSEENVFCKLKNDKEEKKFIICKNVLSCKENKTHQESNLNKFFS